jgi:hypothetical protein
MNIKQTLATTIEHKGLTLAINTKNEFGILGVVYFLRGKTSGVITPVLFMENGQGYAPYRVRENLTLCQQPWDDGAFTLETYFSRKGVQGLWEFAGWVDYEKYVNFMKECDK